MPHHYQPHLRHRIARRVAGVILALTGAAAAAPGDSRYSTASMAARFRQRVPEHPTTFGGGATASLDSLAAHFVAAVASADTVTLTAMRLSVSEFAWLYYADAPLAQPPYELDPDVMWMQMTAQSERGRTRLLARLAGQPLTARDFHCDDGASHGAIRLYTCQIVLRPNPPAAELELPLSIVERDGRFKFTGYANRL